MAKKKYKIPRCPHCNKEITEVYETTYEKCFFNKKTGKYEEFGFGGDTDVRCGNCDAEICEVFEEGVCNYQANKIGEK